MRSVITGTGMHIPPTTVDNHTLSKIMDTSDEWIQVRTGIVERHYAAPDEATSDLAVPAARQAIEQAGIQTKDIDYLVVDGGSSDGSIDLLRSYGDRVRWISERDGGQSEAIHKGFLRTEGKILGWLMICDPPEQSAVHREPSQQVCRHPPSH